MNQKKREMNYLEVAYDHKRKPVTRYPDDLMLHITKLLDLKGGAVLDVGCGRGDQLFARERLGFKVTGLDIEHSTEAIANHHPESVSDNPTHP